MRKNEENMKPHFRTAYDGEKSASYILFLVLLPNNIAEPVDVPRSSIHAST